jgi:hypothetical protein
MKRIAVVLSLVVVVSFALVKSGMSGKPDKAPSIDGEPIWKITQPGTAKSVIWQDADNPRFAIYDSDTPTDEEDDLVLDKETGLVWQRVPDATERLWTNACAYCLQLALGNRCGWRMPTMEELSSLVDTTQNNPSLPISHPFTNVEWSFYWTSSTVHGNTSAAHGVYFSTGHRSTGEKSTSNPVWCVRGGQGYDAY